ncbi:MAG: tagatose-bisphosphate aldolase subunit GatY [Alicyclobacillus sp.]|nr:tagatose-bisphosphate aldolase subunit GatY [Alicyclobacillus sp.]
MSLVSSTTMLIEARKNGYCIGAFNIHTLEMLQAVVEAAAEMDSPVILQSTVGTVKHLGAEYIAAAASVAARQYGVPITLHLDHCTDFSVIMQCIRAGYTSVMIDASHLPFEENVRMTRKVVEVATPVGVNVEAELGRVGGVEDDLTVDDADAMLADPDQCLAFVGATGVPTLAPAIGTAHGIYQGVPRIDFERIRRIAEKVDVPLVLHGGSGIPADHVRRCISLGMAKMNVATELRIIFSDAIKAVFHANPEENDPRKYMIPAKQVLKQVVMDKISLCGSVGRAPSLR